jgi:MYXO-CTERM domain-containing protein
MSPRNRRKHLTPLAIALGVLALTSYPAVAHAVPPAAADFQIRYYVTDADGDRSRLMTQQDFNQFVNQARCECGQNIQVEILLRSQSGQAFDQQRIRTYVGNQCGQGQQGNNDQNRACVLLEDQLPNFYTKTAVLQFAPIWLSTGVANGSSQSIAEAEPYASCETGQGEGGIWICVENGTQTDCQSDEFIITGTQNNNVPAGSNPGSTGTNGTMTGSMGGIRFDYDPPISVPDNYRTSEGDGAVVIEWDFEVTGDISGYRVLCANADGSPVDGKGSDGPSLTDENNGTIYFTGENLCPDGALGQGGGENTPDGGTGTGTGGGSDSGGADTGDIFGTTSAGLYDDDFGDGAAAIFATTGTSGGMGSSSTASTSGVSTTSTGGGASTSGGDTDGTVDVPAGEGIRSLGWEYVCSSHLPQNSQRARVDGLDNGREYIFMVVAYDTAGNPIEASDVIRATPRETIDLWEACELQGDICGDGGFCACTTDDTPRPAAWWAVGLLALVRRRRR